MVSTLARLSILVRPRGALLVVCLPLIGLGYGLWERGSTIGPLRVLPTLALLALAWLVGHAGAMWLNAALDRDEGSVLLGRSVEVPRGASAAGYLALAASPLLALSLGVPVLACALACAVLSVLYSHPRVAWKGHPIAGPMVNGLGYGALSPIAGWAAADGVFTWRAPLTLALLVIAIFGIYFGAQAFQLEEDRTRGYRTLVVTHGSARTLFVAQHCMRAAAVGSLIAAAIGVYPRTVIATLPAWWLADREIARWRAAPNENGQKRAGRWMARLTIAGLGTLACVYADQAWKLLHDEPPGGCGTAIVPAMLAHVCN